MEITELDALDTKILGILSVDSRIPLTQLATRVRASREVITYRLHRLEKQGVIRGYVTDIPYESLGFIGGALFISVKYAQEAAFEKYVSSKPHIAWMGKWVGSWSFVMSVLGRSLDEIDARVQELLRAFPDAIRDYRLIMHKRTAYYHEKLFGANHVPVRKTLPHQADEIDMKILASLATNSRIDASTLALAAGISGVAIGQRIRKLEQAGYIRRYGLFFDIAKLGYKQYSIFIRNNHVAERSRLIAMLSAHPSVHFLFEYTGDQFMEFGVFVKDPYALRAILSEIESTFPENRVLEVHVLQEDLLSVAPPVGVFVQKG